MGHSTPFAICKAQDMSRPQADPLQSDRLALEPLAVDDASEMLTALAPPELYRFTGGEPPTLDELGARYGRQSQGQSEDGSAGWLNWIVRFACGGPAIGFVQATLERKEDGLVADLAWLVTPEEQGRGIAVEAAATVATWLRSIDVRHIRAFIHPDLTASMHVARRTGLAPTSALVDGETLWEAFLPKATEH
ncbi:GNAT family N-acetyltransferase [Curtobacterium flaccumfaciens]|uniref:GNAT family N-acetyltransferase n=1 Tax=Curtobacterium flaccumfaciens TaxID=2035 RepID=UPI00203261D0|nr:GNAT family N-acetyltransferase [Curtobacterium flaccumfaciens]